jgi:hypothetical protein
MSTTVTTQKELNAALADDTVAEIIIDSPRGVWLEIIHDKGKALRAYGSSTVTAYDSSTVTAYDSSTVRAYDSSTVTAYGSSTVTAYDSSTVTAYDSSTVRAYDSSTVRASGSSTVTAYDSSTVRAYDSSTVRAYDSSTVRAGKYTSVHLFSARVKVTGGVVIDVSKIDLADITDWADYYGTDIIGGQVIVYKAVNDELKSPRGFAYPIGETVTAPDWSAGDFCGGGLHLSPSPQGAQRYFEEATRFLKCTVPVAELSVIDPDNRNAPKLKAKTVTVLAEVDIHGNEVTK